MTTSDKHSEPAGDKAEVKDAAGHPSEDPNAAAAGGDQVQANVNEDNEKGFHGVKTDPTPDENYSVAGVIAGLPTPETDDEAQAEADRVSAGLTGPAPAKRSLPRG